MGLFSENAKVTFWWHSGEINGHTFHNIGLSHVNDHMCVAVTKSVVPSLQVRDPSGVETGMASGVWMKWFMDNI